jgi:hypothetical protein
MNGLCSGWRPLFRVKPASVLGGAQKKPRESAACSGCAGKSGWFFHNLFPGEKNATVRGSIIFPSLSPRTPGTVGTAQGKGRLPLFRVAQSTRNTRTGALSRPRGHTPSPVGSLLAEIDATGISRRDVSLAMDFEIEVTKP